MQKTIIVYSSVDGHTKEICQKIASQLEHQVDIVSVDDNPMIEDYDRIIIGASIRYGKYRESLFDFIDKNKNTIDTKKNAFFSVNVVARKKEKNKPETNPYVSKFLKNTNWIPKKYNIQVANSTPIRYFQLFDLKNKNMMFANRGTSGIDGSTSTAIGSSVQNDSPVLLVTGDLSFFYDVNALWNNHIPKNFRIIIINNSGGGIFKILPGFKENNLFSEFIETQHNLSARLIAKMFNFNYTRVSTKFGLNLYLRTFFKNSKKPKILEIKTSSIKSTKILKDYFRYLSKP